MAVSEAVAAYAAIVASAAFGWQVFTWRTAYRNKVTVTLELGIGESQDRLEPAIDIVVRNFGIQPIRVVAAGLAIETADEDMTRIVPASRGNLLEQKVAANDAGYAQLTWESLEDERVDFWNPMIGWVELATGERVESPVSHSLSKSKRNSLPAP